VNRHQASVLVAGRQEPRQVAVIPRGVEFVLRDEEEQEEAWRPAAFLGQSGWVLVRGVEVLAGTHPEATSLDAVSGSVAGGKARGFVDVAPADRREHTWLAGFVAGPVAADSGAGFGLSGVAGLLLGRGFALEAGWGGLFVPSVVSTGPDIGVAWSALPLGRRWSLRFAAGGGVHLMAAGVRAPAASWVGACGLEMALSRQVWAEVGYRVRGQRPFACDGDGCPPAGPMWLHGLSVAFRFVK
jgi:hypothetical protein